MVVATESMGGKFHRFKPRHEWPVEAQTSPPQDELYYTHPVIVLSTLSDTSLVHIVTITSHPKQHQSDVYMPIGFQSTLGIPGASQLHMANISKERQQLPKQSFVKLDSRSTIDIGCLEKFREENSGIQFKLAMGSRRRLVKLVQECEERTMVEIVASLLNTTPKTTPTTSARHSTYSQARNRSQFQLQEIRATIVSLQLEATEDKSQLLHLADINTSLASLKEAIACVKSRTPTPSQENKLVLKAGRATVTITNPTDTIEIEIPSPQGSMKEDNAYRDYLRSQRQKIRSQMYGKRETIVQEKDSAEVDEGCGSMVVTKRSILGRWVRGVFCLG